MDLPLLDALRIVASFAVVRHHMRRDYFLNIGFALPLFLVIMFGLVASSGKNEKLGAFVRRKAAYLLVPWVRWSLIYVAIFIAVDLLHGLPAFGRFEPGMLFYGGEKSLWFLPFAALALWPLKWMQQRTPPWSPLSAGLLAGALGVVATSAATWAVAQDIPDMPVRTWLRVLPAVFWGLAVGQSVRCKSDRERGLLLVSVSAMAVVCFLVTPENARLSEGLSRRFAFAVPLACLGFGVRVPVPEMVRAVSMATFGVYLVHPLVGKVLGSLFDVFAWPGWLHAGIAWTLSILLVLGLRRLHLGWHELYTGRVHAWQGQRGTDH